MITRVWVAYEQLSKVHSDMCRQFTNREANEFNTEELRQILNDILRLQVELGGIGT